MRQGPLLSVLVLLLMQEPTKCIRIRELRVPAHVAEGSEVILGCLFELQGHRLFSVKWMKDGQDFYHYRPGGSVPEARGFSARGVTVDVARSSMETVTLLYMDRDSAGEYRCEVTGEAPHFKKAVAKKNITVDLLPDKEPQVTGLQEHYKVGSSVELNCTSMGARPDSQVQWFINNMPAPRYHLRGPWYTRSMHRLDATDTTLELNFGVMSSHFIYGVMTLKCQATQAPLYRKEVVFKYQLLTRTKQSILIETTTKSYEKTTEKPCTSTITIDIEESPKHFDTWPIYNSAEATPEPVETLGPWCPDAYRLFSQLKKKLSDCSPDHRADSFLGQRISMAIQRGNVAGIMGTLPQGSDLGDIIIGSDRLDGATFVKYSVEILFLCILIKFLI